jgi:flagellar biosynthesis protein FlhA
MFVFAIVPGLPMIPFLVLGGCMGFIAYSIPKQRAEQEAKVQAKLAQEQQKNLLESRDTVKESLKLAEIELCLGKHLASYLASSHGDLAQRVGKMRKKFAQDFGFVLPDVKLSDSLMISPKSYQIKIHGTVVATQEIRPGDLLVVLGDGPVPDVPGDEVREPAFGMKALWTSI